MYSQCAYLLAAAYAQSGKPEAAKEIVGGKWREDWRYDWCGYTYGSDLRDRALILETYTAIGDAGRAQSMANFVCTELGKEQGWYWNTQSLATSLRALSKYATKYFGGQGGAFAYRIGNGAYKNGDSSKPVSTVNFTGSGSAVAVKNNGKTRMYARLIVNGRPVVGDQGAMASNIAMSIRYTDTKGNPVDIARLTQGTDFVAEVTVKRNTSFEFPFNEMALSQTFPSGWEILNARMNAISGAASSPSDYQDVRDDRVYTYFDLPKAYGNQPDTRVYRIQLNAAYAGRYYLPTVACEAMYDNRIRATAPGRWVEVI